MNIIWLGHSGFRLEFEDVVILVDPWLTGNPMLPEVQHEAAVAGATHILVTHGHGDHAPDAPVIAERLGIPVIGIYDLMTWWGARYTCETLGFNKGGTVRLGNVAVTMVNASHSSAQQSADGPIYTGAEAGYMIAGEGHVIYVSGDTDIMADMEWMGEVHAPDIGILCAGGHFTMDMARASYAARKYFNFRTVIPCHYRTFPMLEQSAALMKQVLEGVDVIEPEVMEAITL